MAEETEVVGQTNEDQGQYVFDPDAGKVIQGGGKWVKEWFKLRADISFGNIISFSSETEAQAANRMPRIAAALLLDWSIKDKEGNKVPITPENFEALPVTMVKPIVDEMNGPNFLAQVSAL